MKPRKVVITVELLTDERVGDLKTSIRELLEDVPEGSTTEVIQIQANVIKK